MRFAAPGSRAGCPAATPDYTRLHASLGERSLDLLPTVLVDVIGCIQWFRRRTRNGAGRSSLPGRVVARSKVSQALNELSTARHGHGASLHTP